MLGIYLARNALNVTFSVGDVAKKLFSLLEIKLLFIAQDKCFITRTMSYLTYFGILQ